MRCATLWIGPRLGMVERACLRSVIAQGHPLDLYCYAPVDGVPEGVLMRDAAEVLPESAIVRHATGSVSLFSNRFRYELQRRALGTWVDCDAYLLKPLDMASPYLMGMQEPGVIGTGILRVPPESPMLAPLLAAFEERRVPFWLSPREKRRAWWRRLSGGRTGIAQMPWGSLGPFALSAVAERHATARLALPKDVFYPVDWREADWICRPDIRLEDQIGDRTVSIHLWNEVIKSRKDEPASDGSFLARLQAEGA